MSEFKPRVEGWSNIINFSIILISIFAILLNALVLLLLHRSRWRSAFSFRLVKIIAILDLISGFKECITLMMRYIMGTKASYDSYWFCPVTRTLSLYIPCVTGIFISLLAIERYLILCRSSRLPPTKTLVAVTISCVLILIPQLGSMVTGPFTPDPTGSYCVAGMSQWAKIVRFETNAILFLPFFIIVFCYLNIIGAYSRNSDLELKRPAQNMWLRALIFIFVYSLGFVPITTSILWKMITEQRRPTVFYALIPISIIGITAFNPILVLALQSHLTKDLLIMIKWKPKKPSDMELESV